MPELRIQKALAEAGVASRRAAEELVMAGRVTVNGRTARVGERVDPERDALAVDGREVGAAAGRVYLRLSKPAGVTSTVADRHAERTVLDLVPLEISRAAGRIYPVGRLDRDSEGLLLLTNDGDWAEHVLHPRYEVEREYAVGIRQPLQPPQRAELERGVRLDEGLARLAALRRQTAPETAKLERLVGRSDAPLTWYRAVLTQGWKRQLRRMFAAVGAPVTRLVRVRIGTVWLDGLALGEVRRLTRSERDHLVAGAARRGPAHR